MRAPQEAAEKKSGARHAERAETRRREPTVVKVGGSFAHFKRLREVVAASAHAPSEDGHRDRAWRRALRRSRPQGAGGGSASTTPRRIAWRSSPWPIRLRAGEPRKIPRTGREPAGCPRARPTARSGVAAARPSRRRCGRARNLGHDVRQPRRLAFRPARREADHSDQAWRGQGLDAASELVEAEILDPLMPRLLAATRAEAWLCGPRDIARSGRRSRPAPPPAAASLDRTPRDSARLPAMPEERLSLTGHLAGRGSKQMMDGLGETEFEWQIARYRREGRGADDRGDHRRRLPRPVPADRDHRARPLPRRSRSASRRSSACRSCAAPTRSSISRAFSARGGEPPDLSRHDIRIFAEIVEASDARRSSDYRSARSD